jgi:hypothetical protein
MVRRVRVFVPIYFEPANLSSTGHGVRFHLEAARHLHAGGKMAFTVLGGAAELERNFVERVKAGLRYARSETPRALKEDPGDEKDCHAARQGSWKRIAAEMVVFIEPPGRFQNSGRGFLNLGDRRAAL